MIVLPREHCLCLILLGLAGLQTGCATKSPVVKKSAAQLNMMDQRALQAKELFRQQKYDEAAAILTELTREHTVSQPFVELPVQGKIK